METINSKQKNNSDKVRLMFTHSQANPPVHMWIRQCKELLAKNQKAKKIGDKIQIGSKQPKNLQRLVGGHKSGSSEIPPDSGCGKCNKCSVAQFYKKGRHLEAKTLGKYIKVYEANSAPACSCPEENICSIYLTISLISFW